jgi:CelD/BcsL family acetyltransferase involved in cellulose biosynthesis
MSLTEVQFEPVVPSCVSPFKSVEVRQCGSWDELEQFRPAWNQLLEADNAAAIFLTPEWLHAWWNAYGGGHEIRSLAFISEGELIGLAPMYLEKSRRGLRTLRFIGSASGDSDALNLIVKPGAEDLVVRTIIEYLRDCREWDICSLETLPAESAVTAALQATIEYERWMTSSLRHPHSFIELPATWDEYLKKLQPNFRPLLTRYPKRLQSRYQVRISRCEDPADLGPALERLFALHQMRWSTRGEAGAFSVAARRSFYAEMSRAFLERGWLEFSSLALGHEIAATQFCFRYRDTVSLLQEGFDPRYTEDKVGYALRAHVLQRLMGEGVRCYDFLGGDDSYKLKFGATRSNYLDLHFAGSARGRLELQKRNLKAGLKSWAKQHVPPRALGLLSGVLRRRPAKVAKENL